MLCLFLLSVHASAFEDSVTETTNLTPVADAYVDSSHPDENKGDDSFLWVKDNKYTGSSFIFIKFNLPSITDATIVSAQLKLHSFICSSNSANVSARYISDDSWRECSITYNIRPSIPNHTTYIENVTSHSWCSWDITEDVLEAYRDNKLLTEALLWENTGDNGHLLLYSKEAWFKPVLEITYTIPTSPTPTPSVAPDPTPTPSDISLREFLKNPYLGVPAIVLELKTIIPIVAFLIFLGGKMYMSPNIYIRLLPRTINPDNYPSLKSFIDKYGSKYRHVEIKNIGKIYVDFWEDSCKYIDENGEVKERNSRDYPMNYNEKILPRETRVQIPALWDPNIELEKTPNIIWRIKARDIFGFRYCSCRMFQSKNGGVSTRKEWGKRNLFPGWLFHRKCKLFGGCLYDNFKKGGVSK